MFTKAQDIKYMTWAKAMMITYDINQE